MWASKRGNNANKFMPVFLSLQWLRSSPESKAGWLLCVLQLWFDWLPTTSNEYRLLFVDCVNWWHWTGKKQLLVANCFFNLPSPRWRNGWPTYYACTFCLVRLYHVPFLINVRQVNVQSSVPTLTTYWLQQLLTFLHLFIGFRRYFSYHKLVGTTPWFFRFTYI